MKRTRRIPLLSRGQVAALHWFALVWALAALAGLVVATEFGLLHYKPGGDAYEIRQQQAFGLGYLLAILASLRWRVVGGIVAGMTAAAILVFARNQLQPLDAAIVVLAFTVPGVLWVILDLHQARPRIVALALGLVAVAVVAGGLAATNVYDGLYGPSHPSSSTARLPASDVKWIWSGGVTATEATVTARVRDEIESVQLVVSTGEDFSSPRLVQPSSVDESGVARFNISDLRPGTEYHYAVEADGEVDLVRAGRFATAPQGAHSFTVAFASCMRVGTNGAVFDAIRELNPDMMLFLGDFHYANIEENDPGKFRDVMDVQLTGAALSALFRSLPIAYVWDDHDYGANNADSTTASRPAAMEVYREYVPHYPLAGEESPIYQAFTIGRVRFILTDHRSARTPSPEPDTAGKTMLGAEQKAWFKQQLLDADGTYPLIVWVNGVPWITPAADGGDDWSGYTTERAELAQFIRDNISSEILMLSGDAHMLALDDGTNSDYSADGGSGFPVFHAAALDRPGHTKGGPYSHGMFPGGGQFGVVTVTDEGGNSIHVALSGRTWDGKELITYEYTVTF